MAADVAFLGVILPRLDGGESVIGFPEDVAYLVCVVALWIWLRDGGGHGCERVAGEGWRVGVEDDLVVGTDPAVVPDYYVGVLFPGRFVLPALMGSFGCDFVAPVVVGGVVHGLAIVGPAEGAAAAGGGAVGLIHCGGHRFAGVFAA